MASCKQLPVVVVFALAGACQSPVGESDVACLGDHCDTPGDSDLEHPDGQSGDAATGDPDAGDPLPGDFDNYCFGRADCPPCQDCDANRCSILLITDNRCDPVSCDAHDRACRDYDDLNSNQCLLGQCASPTSGHCDLYASFTDAAASTDCSDGVDLCRWGDVCDGNGGCTPGTTITCTDDPWTCGASRSCNGTSACTVSYPTASCDDGLHCNGTDTCDGIGNCFHTGDPCSSLIGDGDDDCSESCDELTDACSANDPGGGACTDYDSCTVSDSCNGSGTCTGTQVDCTVCGCSGAGEYCDEWNSPAPTCRLPSFENGGGSCIDFGVAASIIAYRVEGPPNAPVHKYNQHTSCGATGWSEAPETDGTGVTTDSSGVYEPPLTWPITLCTEQLPTMGQWLQYATVGGVNTATSAYATFYNSACTVEGFGTCSAANSFCGE